MSKKCVAGAKIEVQTKEGWIDGEIIGFPPVYVISFCYKTDEKELFMQHLLSETNAEEKPSQSFIDMLNKELKKKGLPNVIARTEKLQSNPKIRLTDGKIVYGCQVWWRHKE